MLSTIKEGSQQEISIFIYQILKTMSVGNNSFVNYLHFLSFYLTFAPGSLYCLHIQVSSSSSVYLLSVSLRSSATIQGDSPGTTQTNLPSRPRSRSLCSQRRSSSSSRKSTLAGLSRRRNKAHQNTKTLQPQWKRQVCVFVDRSGFLGQVMFWTLVLFHMSPQWKKKTYG